MVVVVYVAVILLILFVQLFISLFVFLLFIFGVLWIIRDKYIFIFIYKACGSSILILEKLPEYNLVDEGQSTFSTYFTDGTNHCFINRVL